MEQSINHLLVQGPFCGKNLFFRVTTGLLSITLSLTGMWFAKSYNCLHCRNWKISWVSINRGIGWVPPPPPWWFTYATYGPWSEGDLKSSVTHLYVEHVLVETNSLDMQIFQSMPPPSHMECASSRGACLGRLEGLQGQKRGKVKAVSTNTRCPRWHEQACPVDHWLLTCE